MILIRGLLESGLVEVLEGWFEEEESVRIGGSCPEFSGISVVNIITDSHRYRSSVVS